MKLTAYGKAVRKARLDAEITMLDMAEALDVAPSYLSATETGSKKVSASFLDRVLAFFKAKGISILGLKEAADVSNKSVTLDGLPTAQQFLIAGFARTEMSSQEIDEMTKLLQKIRGRNAE